MQVKLTNDKEYVQTVLKALKENGGYCPCQLLHNQNTKCMCKIFREETPVGEECPCGLYIKIVE